MFGLNKYLIMGSVAALVGSNILVGWKSYGFGYDRATVVYEKKISLIKQDIETANDKINMRLEKQQAALNAIENENEILSANADAQEQIILGERLKYQNEIRTRANLCLTSPVDADRLR